MQKTVDCIVKKQKQPGHSHRTAQSLRPQLSAKHIRSRSSERVNPFAFILKISLVALAVIVVVPLVAFEAHIVNVTATIVMIDPPVISPPGGQYQGPLDITIYDDDPDATHIYYTVTPGTDAGLAPDPVCGISAGGPKPLDGFTIEDDSVVKAIACAGDTPVSHSSFITTEIYDLTIRGKIEGHKYHDLDKSGTFSPGDVALQGWHVELFVGTSTIGSTVTDDVGYYTFNDLEPGTYVVVEEARTGWEPVTLSSMEITLGTGETKTVNYFNFDTGYACVPDVVSFTPNLAVQAAGATSGNDDVVLTNNSEVHGDVRSNDEIEKDNSNGPRTIFGNATATNTIDPIITVTGVTSTGASAVALPDIHINTWKARAQAGGTVNGSFTFPNNTTGLVMGPTEIMGNLTFGSSNGVLLKGPIYVHGNLTIGANTIITQDASFGDQFMTIIVDGVVEIDSNISFVGAGTTGAFLLVSTHAAVAGDAAAIETNSNNSDLGDVVLYASDGDIHIRSNRQLLAIFATHGTGNDSDDNAAVRIDSNVRVNYRPLPTTISCGPRQPYETTSHVLINEFIPNPTGDDQGTAGAPLDGEWVEIFNPTGSSVDVAGYVLYDSDNTHALPITSSNVNTGTTVIPSVGRIVVYRDGDGDFALNNSGGDTVRLFSNAITSGGVLVDSHAYTRNAPDDKSFARIPDGAANWIDPDGTPGEPNLFFFEPLPDASPSEPAFEAPQNPPIDVSPPNIEPPYVPPPPESSPDTSGTVSTDNADAENVSSTTDVVPPPSESASSTPSDTAGNGTENASSTPSDTSAPPQDSSSTPPTENSGTPENTSPDPTPPADTPTPDTTSGDVAPEVPPVTT